MSITEYLKNPVQTRKEIVEKADWKKCPYWLERLQTAINSSNPLAVSFSPDLLKEYQILKS